MITTSRSVSTRPRFWHVQAPVLVLALLVGAAACHDPDPTPSAGSNSNWLQACTEDTTCGSRTACRCGACTRDCATDADCAGLADARCVPNRDPGLLAQCGNGSRDAGICLPACTPGSCGEGRACVAGGCVLVSLPPGPFCDPVAASSPENREAEDSLLEALQNMRTSGGVDCGSGQATLPETPLRLDARLVCAARVLAADMSVTRARSLTDSTGRDTRARLSAAGYADSGWAESFALNPNSAEDALRLMLEDASSCQGLTNPSRRDVGVGSVGTVRIVTLASE
jgi:hypothetical protein